MTVFLTEKAYDLIKNRGVCAPASIVAALGDEYKLQRAPHGRAHVGQVVRLDFAGDGIERLGAAANNVPLTVSDYVSQKIVSYFGGAECSAR